MTRLIGTKEDDRRKRRRNEREALRKCSIERGNAAKMQRFFIFCEKMYDLGRFGTIWNDFVRFGTIWYD